MSKKVSIILSVILFLALVALIICENCYPEAGAQFLSGLLQ